MDRAQLQQAIEHHELLRLPRSQRLSADSLRMDLTCLVMRACGFEQKLESRLAQEDAVALLEQENEMEQALYQKKGRAKKFDSLAFMTAFNSALKNYDAASGVPFLGFFHTIYSREIVKTARQQRSAEHQELMVTLALCEAILSGRGAVRVHGGGFGGTAQAFVPLDLLEEFKTRTEAVLGQGSCHVVTIRPVGGVRLG